MSNTNTKQNNYGTIATKIADEHKQQLEKALEKKEINFYQWFQMMAEVTIRMFDVRHQLTPAMSKMIQLFQMIPGWKNPTTLLDPNDEPEVEKAVYMVNTKGKTGLKLIMTERGWMDGQWRVTENVMDIVEAIIEACLPQSYYWLRQKMVDLGCQRVFECILKIADDAAEGSFERDIQEMFTDNDRGDFGQKPQTTRTKQRKYVGVDDMQGLLAFDDFDARMAVHTQEEIEDIERQSREASEFLANNNDFKPHGGEW